MSGGHQTSGEATHDSELVRRRETLAEYLRTAGAAADPQWLAVFATVPRHLFVPQFHRTWMDQGRVRTETIAAPSARWRETVYTDTALVTRPDATSSSTAPSVMARMLDALRVGDGDDVLEIGTGTGYNTALLCERLGSERVYSIGVDPDLVETARVALRALGHDPALVARDGREGLLACAPYQHVIATCRVDAVPGAWVTQLRPHGTIVAPVSTGIVRLVADADSRVAAGRFLPDEAYFMTARDTPARPDLAQVARTAAHAVAAAIEPRGARPGIPDPAALWTDPHARFWLELIVPATVRGQAGDATLHYRADGSWIRITERSVERGGPHDLWEETAKTYQHWRGLGQPRRDRIGLTVTPTGHTVWLDDPGNTIVEPR